MASSLAIGLFALEVFALVLDQPGRFTSDPSLWADRPELGWGPSKAGKFQVVKTAPSGEEVYDTQYTIDPALIRHTEGASTGSPIAFFGDSLTFGEGVNDDATMPQAFSDLNGRRLRVLNFGYSAYGPAQTLRALQLGLFDTLLQKPRMFILLTAAWHAERTSCLLDYVLRGPRYAWTGDALVYQGSCASPSRQAWANFLFNTAFYRVFIEPRTRHRLDDHDFELYTRIVVAAAKLAQTKYDSPMMVLYIRSPNYPLPEGWSDDQIMSRMRASGVEVVDASLPDRPDLIIRGDPHPTPIAHRMRAELLERVIAKDHPDVLQPGS